MGGVIETGNRATNRSEDVVLSLKNLAVQHFLHVKVQSPACNHSECVELFIG